MILYLDTSAFVRMYINEAQHVHILALADAASVLTTHLIAYTEMRAALARMKRMRRLDEQAHKAVRQAFETDWEGMEIIQTTEPLVRRAGDLVEGFGLRGYDSVHLAAAESVFRHVPALTFACFDSALNAAAQALGMETLA